jgi:drug/metabolite transporter (DMT)-like permease
MSSTDPDSKSYRRPPALAPYLWMLCGSFSFAWMGTVAYGLRSDCDWRITALARSGLALVFAVLLARASGVRLVLWRPKILWLRSIAGSVSLVCTFYALTKLPQSHVLTFTSTFPIWIAILSWPLYGETPSLQVWLSVFSSVCGVALIQQPTSGESTWADLSTFNPAALVALLGAFTTAVAMLGLNRLQGVQTWAIVVHFSAVAFVVCIASVFLGQQPPELDHVLRAPTLLMLLVVGVTATIGQSFLTRAFATGPPSKVAVVSLTQIVFAMILDVLLWHQDFHPVTLLGIALVVAPTAWLMATKASEIASKL